MYTYITVSNDRIKKIQNNKRSCNYLWFMSNLIDLYQTTGINKLERGCWSIYKNNRIFKHRLLDKITIYTDILILN